MTARTSWSARAEGPPHRDIDPAPDAPDHAPFADLLDSRFDESGRLVRRGASARTRMAERLNRELPDVDADDLEQAVARLSRQIEAATRGGAAQRSVDRSGEEARRRQAAELEADHHEDAGRQWPEEEGQAGSVLDVLNRLEARLDALSQKAGGRGAGDSAPRRRQEGGMPARTAKAASPEPKPGRADPVPDLKAPEEHTGSRHGAAQESGISEVREELDRLIRQVETLDRNDRWLARAMESIRDRLGELHDGLAERPDKSGEAMAAIAERLEALSERLGAAELAPSAIDAVERSYEHLLERIGHIERLSERSAPPPDLGDRLERLRRTVQGLPGQEALSALEDRVLDLAERIDAASERGTGGRAVARLEAQLGEMATALAGLKEAEQARSRDIEKRLAELLRRIEAGARGSAKVDLSSLQERLDEILARVDGASDRTFSEAIGSLEARLDALGRALDERPAIDLDPLSRQLKQLQGRLDQVSRSMQARSDPVDIEPLHRRLEGIQQQLETSAPGAAQADPQVVERLQSIEQRLSGLSSDPLNRQLEDIQQRLEASTAIAAPADPELAERLKSIEDRLSGLSGGSLPDFEPLREQLGSIAARLESVTPAEQPDPAKLAALTDRLEALFVTIGADDTFAGFGDKIAKLSAALDTMNDAPALEEIADLRTEIALLRREFKSLPGGGAAASETLEPLIKDLAGRLDRLPTEGTLTTSDLEAQVDRIVNMLEEPGPDRQSLAPIEESLRRIEEQLESGSRAALQSVLSEVNGLAAGEGDNFARLVSALSADLNAVKETASASQHNMRETLAAVHETLESMAKRMAALDKPERMAGEGRTASPAPRGARQHVASPAAEPAFDPAPMPEIALGAAGRKPAGGAPRPEPRPTAEPAAGPEPPSAGSQSLLGRLTSGQLLKRATGGRTESFSPALDEADDAPDLPLEPGSEEPMSSTLENAPSSDTALFSGAERRKNRIPGRAGAVNRRKGDGGYVADDFLSAARRAAQTAAIEAAEAEKSVETSGKGGALNRLFGLVKARRRAVAAAALALAVAFAALQFARLGPGEEEEQVARAPAAQSSEVASTAGPPTQAGSPARPEAQLGEPSRPDSALAFGDPLDVPDPLQRNIRSAQTAESAAGAEQPAPDVAGTEASAAAGPWPPEAIGTEKLRRAAAEGLPAAQFEVAARFAEGRGVQQDVEKAAEWYRRAAEGGLAPAQYRLGSIYEKGLGVPKDPATAMQWYRRAAEAGNAKAMHNLAVLYAEGADGESDLGRAAEWFGRAAERGVRDSQFNIGVLHARGLGVPQDLIEAYKWFAVSAQSGDPQAAERRDVLTESMSPEDLQKARAAASAFRPLMVDPAANVVEPPEGGWGETEPAKVSLNSDLVRTVQDLLAARGFDVGPADGRLGPSTRSAVAEFQRQLGLPATGEINAGVVAALQQHTS